MPDKNLDNSLLTFPQDNLISFDEEKHRYSVDGVGEMTPVSCVVGSFFKPFDAMYWSMIKSGGDEEKAALMREQWEAKGKIAAQIGTFLHRQIELYINKEVSAPELSCVAGYKGKYIDIANQVDISKEWSYFKMFDESTNYLPFRTEWRIFDATHKIAGTTDLVCRCEDGTFEIYDWKRSNKIEPEEVNKFSTGINGLSHLTDTTYIHYCLQQNLYKYIIETNYGLKISRMSLVVLHPDYNGYRIVNIPEMRREVEIMLSNR